jgi:hypothetical protein
VQHNRSTEDALVLCLLEDLLPGVTDFYSGIPRYEGYSITSRGVLHLCPLLKIVRPKEQKLTDRSIAP